MRERQRADEERLRRETEEGLRAFREAQRGAGAGGAELGEGAREGVVGGGEEDGGDDGVVGWSGGGAGGRKRKRDGGRTGLRGVVKRRVSRDSQGKGKGDGDGADTGKEPAPARRTSGASEPARKASVEVQAKGAVGGPKTSPAPASAVGKPKLGLVDYGSDSDEDEGEDD